MPVTTSSMLATASPVRRSVLRLKWIRQSGNDGSSEEKLVGTSCITRKERKLLRKKRPQITNVVTVTVPEGKYWPNMIETSTNVDLYLWMGVAIDLESESQFGSVDLMPVFDE